MVFCTEKSAAVYSLPSQRQMYTQTINESTFVVSKISNFTKKKYIHFLSTIVVSKAYIWSKVVLMSELNWYFTQISSFFSTIRLKICVGSLFSNKNGMTKKI